MAYYQVSLCVNVRVDILVVVQASGSQAFIVRWYLASISHSCFLLH